MTHVAQLEPIATAGTRGNNRPAKVTPKASAAINLHNAYRVTRAAAAITCTTRTAAAQIVLDRRRPQTEHIRTRNSCTLWTVY